MPNSATLVQALGAAFCAILCALSGMGGGGMMIGARTAAWAKSGGWVNPYVTDGLVLHLDGLFNAGVEKHETTPEKWVDLSGSGHDFVNHGVSFDDDSALFEGGYFDNLDEIQSTDGQTLEYLFTTRRNFLTSNGNIAIVHLDKFAQHFQVCAFYTWIWSAMASTNEADRTMSRSLLRQYGIAEEWHSMSYSKRNAKVSESYIDGGPIDISQLSAGTSYSAYGNGLNTIGCRSDMGMKWVGWKLRSLRYYNRSLTDEEIAANNAVDKARFGLT